MEISLGPAFVTSLISVHEFGPDENVISHILQTIFAITFSDVKILNAISFTYLLICYTLQTFEHPKTTEWAHCLSTITIIEGG